MKTDWESIKTYIGPSLMGAAALTLLVILVLVFLRMAKLFIGIKVEGAAGLALLAIGGVLVLIMMLTAVAMIFSVLKLTNSSQAMGLPEGSIRAVIALSLIVLFAILSVFLYQGVSTGGAVNTLDQMSEADRLQFIQTNPTARDVQSTLITAPGVIPRYFKVTYRTANPIGDDFAKQLLVLLGTLMTAVTSFYLGAGTATSVAKEAKETQTAAIQAAILATSPPTISGINPSSHSITNDGATIKLELSGANLDSVKNVKLVRGAENISGTIAETSPTRAICNIPVTATTAPPGAPWDVVIDDGGSKSATRAAALTIT